MSKKDKLKFKKRIKAQLLEEMSRSPEAKAEVIAAKPAKIESFKEQLSPLKASPQPVIASSPTDENLKFIKKDLRKSAIIIGSIIIAILAVFFIDNKTGFLLKSSSSLFKLLHIN